MADLIKSIITRIDTTANWTTLNPIPANGEQCIEILKKGLFKLKIGDGVTPWIALKYETLNDGFEKYKKLLEKEIKERIEGDEALHIALIDGLATKITHYAELPEITEENAGEVSQYIGETTEDFTENYFYKAIYDSENPENSHWERVSVQPETDLTPVWEAIEALDDKVDEKVEELNQKIEETAQELDEKKVTKTDDPLRIYGTDDEGKQTTYDIDVLGLVDDVMVKNTEDEEYATVVDNEVAYIDLSKKVDHYNVLPEATIERLGQIAQYIGETTDSYIHGLFYEAALLENPEEVWFETNVDPASSVEFNENTFLENLQPTEHIIYMLTYVADESKWYYNGQEVDPAFYGVTYDSEFIENGSNFRIEYIPSEEYYGWTKVDTTDISEKVDKTHEGMKIYGTDEYGNQHLYDKEDFGKVDDVRLNGVSVVGIKEEKVADIDLVAADSEYHNDAVSSITNVQQALDNLMNIHYYINPSYTTFTVDRSGNYDVGTVLSQPFTVTWVLNKQPESGDTETLKYEGTTLLNIMSLEDHSKWKSGTYTYTNNITSNSPKTYTFRVDYTDNHSTVPSGKTGSCSATRTFNFMYRRYWGVTSTETLSDEQLYALSNELSTSRSQERDFNCTGGKYWWFVIPTTYCSGIQFTDVGSGLPMTLPPECISSRTITNSQGISYSVNVYRGEFKQTASSVKIKVS